MPEVPGGSLTLLGVFLMGLGLNLTPCVYPLISVTVSLFGSQKEIHHGHSFLKAVLYVLGMATMYSSLGVVAALTGELFGSLLQNRWILMGIAALLSGLALSMLGIYTFQLPGWILQKAGGKKNAGLLGVYLSGLFVGIFAAPCVGPPIIALLTFIGMRGDPWFAFQIFFVMSLGLGAPYLFLGTFSGLLRKLPKSGVWLLWVERFFGIVLLVFAAFYMILAWNAVFLKWLPSAAFIAGGIYLGFVEHSADYPKSFLNFKKLFGVLAILMGIGIPFFALKETVRWDIYSPEKLAQAKENGKPVIIDFYADWCIPCHELDQFTYSDKNVLKILEGFDRLKVDLTDPDAKTSSDIMDRYQIVGVPSVLFFDTKGEEVKEIRVTGFVSAKEMLEILRSPRLKKTK